MTTEPLLLGLVRERTRGPHQRLEARIEELGYLKSLDGFARHLFLLHAHHAQVLDQLTFYPRLSTLVQQRVEELSRDLNLLSTPFSKTSSSKASSSKVSRPNPKVEPLTYSRGLGWCYVIEGSRLGGPAVRSQLERAGIATQPFASLSASTEELRARWRTFTQLLQTDPDVEAYPIGSKRPDTTERGRRDTPMGLPRQVPACPARQVNAEEFVSGAVEAFRDLLRRYEAAASSCADFDFHQVDS